jgi:hypothetical protein
MDSPKRPESDKEKESSRPSDNNNSRPMLVKKHIVELALEARLTRIRYAVYLIS